MSFTLIDFFNAFQSMKEKRRFLANTQSTYFAILAKFNAAHYPSELPITTRELKDDAGLKSVSTAHECRNVLKNHKLIDFQTAGGTTIYRLLTEHLPNKNTGSAEQEPNSERTQFGLLSIPAHGEVKKLDTSSICLSARARKNVAEATPLAAVDEVADVKALSAPETELDDVLDFWTDKLTGGRLTFEHQSQIAKWLKAQGVAWVKEAMSEAADANGNSHGLSFKFLRGVVERKLKVKPCEVTTAPAQSSQEPPRRRDSATADELRARMFDD